MLLINIDFVIFFYKMLSIFIMKSLHQIISADIILLSKFFFSGMLRCDQNLAAHVLHQSLLELANLYLIKGDCKLVSDKTLFMLKDAFINW